MRPRVAQIAPIEHNDAAPLTGEASLSECGPIEAAEHSADRRPFVDRLAARDTSSRRLRLRQPVHGTRSRFYSLDAPGAPGGHSLRGDGQKSSRGLKLTVSYHHHADEVRHQRNGYGNKQGAGSQKPVACCEPYGYKPQKQTASHRKHNDGYQCIILCSC